MNHDTDKSLLGKQAGTKPISVLEAKRKHIGTWSVIGKIVTVSEMYVVEVPANLPTQPQIEFKDARSIQLEDIEKLDENERLDIRLFNDDILNVIPGEVVEVTGSFELVGKVKKNSKVKTVLVNATKIKYVNRKELVITPRDIIAFEKFAHDCKESGCNWNLRKRLVAMFAPNIIGHEYVKLGLLRSIVGGDDRGQGGGGRVNTFMVGDPGTAKSTLGQEAAKIKPNSRHVSAPHATSKTITAIADKENETVSVRLGAIPLSRNAICAIDEITAFSPEEQGRLLDVLEEGKLDVDKHGRHWTVPAPTTIIATANPIQSRWTDRDSISNDQVNIIKTLLDRFQQVYAFKDDMDSDQIDKFVIQMSTVRKRKPHNYNFLRKYLVYASSIEVNTISPEAEQMLNDFWKEAKKKGRLSIRAYRALFSIAESQAKLHLKDTINEQIAKQAMESVQLMMVQYGETIKVTENPREVTYSKFLEILQNQKIGIAIKSLCEIACKEHKQVSAYLGSHWSIKNNKKLKVITEMLKNHTKVRVIGNNPLVFLWFGNEGDQSDQSDLHDNRNANVNTNMVGSPRSPRSPSTVQACNKCGENLDSDPYYAKIHRCEGTD